MVEKLKSMPQHWTAIGSLLVALFAFGFTMYNVNSTKNEERIERLIKCEEQLNYSIVRINAIENNIQEIRKENKDNNEKINIIYNALLRK